MFIWDSSLSTPGLADRQATQKLEYKNKRTGFPEYIFLLKSSKLEYLSDVELKVSWKVISVRMLIIKVHVPNFMPKNLQPTTVNTVIKIKAIIMNEYLLIIISIVVKKSHPVIRLVLT